MAFITVSYNYVLFLKVNPMHFSFDVNNSGILLFYYLCYI